MSAARGGSAAAADGVRPAVAADAVRPAAATPLALDSIGKTFGRRRVLTAATLVPAAGRVTVVLGRNGTGKSTLIRIATGQIRPDHGRILLDGEPVRRPRLHRLARRGVFHLPDEPLLARTWTLREHIDLVRRRFDAAEAARGWVERLGIGGLLDAPAGSLSSGERRRSELCLALVRSPRVLLCDEPLHSMAPIDAELLCDALREHAHAKGAAVVVTGHEAGHLLDLADDVVWMTAGTTHALGSPDHARSHHQFRREYLGELRTGAPRSGRRQS